MYEPARYVAENSVGTAHLLGEVAKRKRQIEALVVASSMSVYGDSPEPAREDQPLDPRSIYALTKYDQEVQSLVMGEALGIRTVALRLFNTYGAYQSLANPYTGVVAIFASRLLNDQPPIIFGDGEQTRDFVHVSDVARAFATALENERASGVYNVGTGRSVSVLEVADVLARALEKPIQPVHRGPRRGDVLRCIANTDRAEAELGFVAQTKFEDGIVALKDWLRAQTPPDRQEQAVSELEAAGLLSE
jgi:dTDP-L-rhamnose 4-epimerase